MVSYEDSVRGRVKKEFPLSQETAGLGGFSFISFLGIISVLGKNTYIPEYLFSDNTKRISTDSSSSYTVRTGANL
ncbi:MAG: hypothetical protein LUO93_08490, partial [Methanomicrobiales archaeon]|nr:hypothetical protein [Methanomicrobiales archaeon]